MFGLALDDTCKTVASNNRIFVTNLQSYTTRILTAVVLTLKNFLLAKALKLMKTYTTMSCDICYAISMSYGMSVSCSSKITLIFLNKNVFELSTLDMFFLRFPMGYLRKRDV